MYFDMIEVEIFQSIIQFIRIFLPHPPAVALSSHLPPTCLCAKRASTDLARDTTSYLILFTSNVSMNIRGIVGMHDVSFDLTDMD